MPKRHNPVIKERAWKLRQEGKSAREISRILGVHRNTLSFWFSPASRKDEVRQQQKKNQRQSRARKKTNRRRLSLDPRACANCRRKFKPKRKDQKYCCVKCRKQAYSGTGVDPEETDPAIVGEVRARQRRRKQGRELRGSPLALDLEERVRRRLEAAE